MSAKHTKWPWQIIRDGAFGAITIYAADGETPIATTCSNTSPKTMQMHRDGEVKANAHLIAAAPELLEALQYAEQWIVEAVNSRCAIRSEQTLKQLRAAIAKAEGGAA